MISELVTSPATEPILYQEVLTHMRINPFDEEIDENSIAYIERLIEAVRGDAEDFTNRKFITQTWKAYYDYFPNQSYIELPYPAQSVSSVKYTDCDGAETTMTLTTDYLEDLISTKRPGRIVLPHNGSWPTATLHPVNPIVIEFVAGYGDLAEDVPPRIKQAMLLEIASLYDNRETLVEGKQIQRLDTYERALYPFKVSWV